jgi:predicted negative regulator of RcsB-dependent stress response
MYDLEEQEKVDLMRAWWQQHRQKVWIGVGAAAAIFVGFNGFQHWKTSQAERAASAYASFQEAVKGGDLVRVKTALEPLLTASASSPYAARAALEMGQFLLNAKDTKGAAEDYQWVIDHASEPTLVSLARIRLAGVLADDQKYTEALKLLETGIDSGFEGMAQDRAGDIYLADNKPAEAKKAYQAALKAMDSKHPLMQVVTIKLDALGGSASKEKDGESK